MRQEVCFITGGRQADYAAMLAQVNHFPHPIFIHSNLAFSVGFEAAVAVCIVVVR